MRWTWITLAFACTIAPAPAAPNPAAADPAAADPPDPPATEPRDAPPRAQGPDSKLSADAKAFVDVHNKLRAKHCARPLTWAPRLAKIAQDWANALRDKGCAFEHSHGSTGENLAAGTSGTLDPTAVVQMWYDEVAQYKFPDGGFSMKTGHFTQVVWRGTQSVGCGRSQCKGLDIYVCEYDPPGNWEGEYRKNVLPKNCQGD